MIKLISKIFKKLPNNQLKWKMLLRYGRTFNFDIHVANTEVELAEIYKFRYDIYVESLNRDQKFADHLLRMIKEPLDKTAINVGAWVGNKLVGVVRLNLRKDGSFMYYDKLYSIDLFNDLIDNSSIVTKLMVSKNYRKTPLSLMLSLKCYEIGHENNIEVNFIDCNPHLLKYFLMLGYRYYSANITHPEFGSVTPLVLINQDAEYLKKINSPFYSICNRGVVSNKGSEIYRTQFSKFEIQKI